jgi:hypothetical protein
MSDIEIFRQSSHGVLVSSFRRRAAELDGACFATDAAGDFGSCPLFAAGTESSFEQKDDALIDKVDDQTSWHETSYRHGLTSKRHKTYHCHLNKQKQHYRTPKPKISSRIPSNSNNSKVHSGT